jgi:transcription termination/antitermination protein NusA
LEVNKTAKGPQVILSRSHPGFVKNLFELEVPEVMEGTVEIKSVSREAGDRAKISVWSKNEKVDSVGACVGIRGSRVKGVVKELQGEKIDIVRWSENVEEYIRAALAPAEVASVKILDADEKKVEVVVNDDQLSLAIGKSGQNVRLASKLTGWSIDIRSKKDLVKEKLDSSLFEGEAPPVDTEPVLDGDSLESIEGVGTKTAEALRGAGIQTVTDLKQASKETLSSIKGIGKKTLEKILTSIGRADEIGPLEEKE